jgi:predicted DNA-binding transcriptional regulator AlpA
MANETSLTPPTRDLPIPGTLATSTQCCAKYQISRTTWWRWTKIPGFPQPLRLRRAIRWDIEAVDAFLTRASR